MNPDVFLSLLALDAYNRGYGQNVLLYKGDSPVSQAEAGRKIGNATILSQSNVLAGSTAVNADSYAIAYDWNSERVISYREPRRAA